MLTDVALTLAAKSLTVGPVGSAKCGNAEDHCYVALSRDGQHLRKQGLEEHLQHPLILLEVGVVSRLH